MRRSQDIDAGRRLRTALVAANQAWPLPPPTLVAVGANGSVIVHVTDPVVPGSNGGPLFVIGRGFWLGATDSVGPRRWHVRREMAGRGSYGLHIVRDLHPAALAACIRATMPGMLRRCVVTGPRAREHAEALRLVGATSTFVHSDRPGTLPGWGEPLYAALAHVAATQCFGCHVVCDGSRLRTLEGVGVEHLARLAWAATPFPHRRGRRDVVGRLVRCALDDMPAPDGEPEEDR